MTLDLALSYAARGWPVFPCRAKEEMDPNTGEILSEKTPYTSNGLKGASVNERIIREWWRRTPDAMVGVPTGRPTKVWVLDLDRKPGVGDGHDWLEDMEAEHGSLPDTARAKTMGGGTHIFFNHVEGIRNRGGLGVAVDVRGDGGYIVAPGSLAADGRSYEWLVDGPIADAPEWLLALVLPPPVTHHAPSDYSYPSGSNDAYVERAMEDELRKLATLSTGRGYQLNASAFSLGTLVGAGALSRQDAEAGLYDAARACGVLAKDGERETRAKIKRGLDTGSRQPRHIPERSWEGDNDNTRLVDISRMIANGLAKARAKSGLPEAEIAKPGLTSEAEDKPESSNTEAEPEPEVLERPPAIVATPFSWVDPKTLSRREFVYGTHYIRKYVSVTSSPGGLGKTSNSIVEALSMATQKPLLGHKPPLQVKVWLFNAEDPRDEMERRIMAACVHYRLKPEEIAGQLFLDTGREQDLVVAIDDKKTGVRIQQPIVEAVVEQIKAHHIDVMIIDPFVSTHRVNENDNGAIDAVAKLWGKIADETNCAIDVVHHIRKVSDRDATVEDSRGAVSLISAARSARILNQMSADQAKEAGINAEDRFSYFNVNAGKSNMTVRSGRVDWRKLVSVPLGNGRGLTKPQDFAGVVTEWKWPSTEAVVEAVPVDHLELIKVKVANTTCRLSDQSQDWVGYVIADCIGMDLPISKGMTADKRHIKRMIEAWIDAGVFVKERCEDPARVGRMAEFVRLAA